MKAIHHKIRGFTFVEMLVVIGIIILVTSIAVPGYRQARATARSGQCASRLRSIGVALNTYFIDHGMKFPELVVARESRTEDVPAIDTVLLEYVKEDELVFQCPSDHEGFYERTGSSYFWNSLVNGQNTANLEVLGMRSHSSGIPLVSDKENFHDNVGDGVNVLYADGHVLNEVQFIVGNR